MALLGARLAAAAEPDAGDWARILAARVNAAGEVAYRTLEAADEKALERHLDTLAGVDPKKLGRDAAVAFWLNAYHALAIAAVLHGERPTIVTSRARMYHWYARKIAGQRRMLDDVRVVLNAYASVDPRIHLAIANGTRGGPRLAAVPYTADGLDAELAAAARRFVNDAEKNRVERAGRRVELSRLFDWYRSDFEREAGSLQQFLAPLAAPGELREALDQTEIQVHYLPFDWRLNAAPGEDPK